MNVNWKAARVWKHAPSLVNRRLSMSLASCAALGLSVVLALGLSSCSGGRDGKVEADAEQTVTVGVTQVAKKTLSRQITLSSELVPFQEIDVYAKESGYVKELNVDYGTRVQADQVIAMLEIPELQLQLTGRCRQTRTPMITYAQNEVSRVEAQHNVLHLQYTRLGRRVAKASRALVAQQEVDDAQGKDLAAAAQVEAARPRLQSAQSQTRSRQGQAGARSGACSIIPKSRRRSTAW